MLPAAAAATIVVARCRWAWPTPVVCAPVHTGVDDVALAYRDHTRTCPEFLVLNPTARAGYAVRNTAVRAPEAVVVHVAPAPAPAPRAARCCVPWRNNWIHDGFEAAVAVLCAAALAVCLGFWMPLLTNR